MAGRRCVGRGGVAVMKSKASTGASTEKTSPAAFVWGLSSRQTAIFAAILIAAVAVYIPSLRNGWVFDDWDKFVNNKFIHSWAFVWKSFIYDSFWFRNPARLPQGEYYRPLENAVFAAYSLLFGTHIAAWHLGKIVLHLIAVVLCFRVAQRLSGNVAVGLLTAAIFAVMPAHVDPVVWISAIPEPLSTALELGALLCLIGRKPGWSGGMLFALALYGCAQLTHESAIAFPLIVAAYVFLIEGGANQQLGKPRRNAGMTRKRIIAAARVSAPFGVLALVYLCVRVKVLGHAFGTPQHATTLGFIAAARQVSHYHGLVDYILTLPVVILADLGVLAVPGMAGPAHAVDWVTRVSPITLVSAGVLLILAAAAWVLIRRSSDRRLYLFCAAWSLLAIAPAMSLHSIWSLVGDRYLYAPSFGWSLAMALAAVRIAAASPRARATVGTAMAILLAAYMATAIRIEPDWHDDLTFFKQCVAADPGHVDFHCRLALAMEKAHDFEGATQELQRAAALDPSDGYVHLKLGQEYMRMGRKQDFDRELRKAFQLFGNPIPPSSDAESSSASQPAATR